jgi:hypothetical protein
MTDPDIKSLRGGKKQMFIREHYEEIMASYHRNGVEVTMRKYFLSPATMVKILRGNKQPVMAGSGDRALDLAQMANLRSIETKKSVNELKHDYLRFQDTVSEDIRNKFLVPLMQLVIRIPPELEAKDDRLRLSDVVDLEEKL